MHEILGKPVYVAQVFGETEDHWLLKVGKRDDVTFDLEDNPELNRFFTIIFVKDPPDA